MPELDYADWEKWSANFPQAHLLQTAQWGELKSEFGWKAVRLIDEGNEYFCRRTAPLPPASPGIHIGVPAEGTPLGRWDRYCRMQ